MSGRFVIQKHFLGEGFHYDLMLEDGGALATWRVGRLPGELEEGESCPAEALASHRLAYMDYQGPVSGDRGRVEIADRGRYTIIARDEQTWQVRLEGERFSGDLVLTRGQASWSMSRPARPALPPA
jgi:hypothetical protein